MRKCCEVLKVAIVSSLPTVLAERLTRTILVDNMLWKAIWSLVDQITRFVSTFRRIAMILSAYNADADRTC